MNIIQIADGGLHTHKKNMKTIFRQITDWEPVSNIYWRQTILHSLNKWDDEDVGEYEISESHPSIQSGGRRDDWDDDDY
jgi:hypothetical protein